jgi:hypothetical protein
MPEVVDFANVSTAGLESSPVAEALAGLRANEARYSMNKYKHQFTVVSAPLAQQLIHCLARDAERLGQRRNGEPVVGQEVLAQHLSRMGRPATHLAPVGNAHGAPRLS